MTSRQLTDVYFWLIRNGAIEKNKRVAKSRPKYQTSERKKSKNKILVYGLYFVLQEFSFVFLLQEVKKKVKPRQQKEKKEEHKSDTNCVRRASSLLIYFVHIKFHSSPIPFIIFTLGYLVIVIKSTTYD